MDYVNVVFHTPLWHVSDITVTFACLANSNNGCSLSRSGRGGEASANANVQALGDTMKLEINCARQTAAPVACIDIVWRNCHL